SSGSCRLHGATAARSVARSWSSATPSHWSSIPPWQPDGWTEKPAIRHPVTVPVPAVGGLRVRCDSAICDPGWRAVGRIEMEYRVLGPVEVLADGRPVAIGGPGPRSARGWVAVN